MDEARLTKITYAKEICVVCDVQAIKLIAHLFIYKYTDYSTEFISLNVHIFINEMKQNQKKKKRKRIMKKEIIAYCRNRHHIVRASS